MPRMRGLQLARSFGAYGLGPAVALLSAPLLARALGPSGRGELAALLQPLTVADAFAAFGVPAACAYFIAQGHNPSKVRRLALTLVTMTAACTFVVLATYSEVIASRTGVERAVVIGLWSTVFLGAFVAVRRSEFQGTANWVRIDAERSLGPILRLTAIVVLATWTVSESHYYAIAYVGSGLFAALILVRGQRRRIEWQAAQSAPRKPLHLTSFTKYASLASFGTISVAIGSKFDQAFLPSVAPVRELGYYSVAATVAEVPLILALLASRNILTEASRGDWSRVSRTLKACLGAATFLALVISALAASLVPRVFGNDFSPAVPSVYILVVGAVVTTATLAFAAVLGGAGFPGLASAPSAVAAVGSVAMLFIFADEMTSARAALISTAAQSLALALSLILIVRCRREFKTT